MENTISYRRTSTWAPVIAIGFCTVQFAQAQGTANDTEVLETIVITALKRETVLLDTPVAISALSEQTLKESGVTSINDLQNVAPSVQINASPFGSVINIRGVTTTDNTSKGDQGIAFNVDGITVGRPRESGAAFFDVNRIEVLRGPQGTLYGKSTTGGVINVISNRPTSESGGSLDLELADYDTKRITGVVNVPVTDKFAVRGALDYNKHDGYLPTHDGSPAFNDQDNFTARVSGLYNFSDVTSLFVTATIGEVGGVGAGAVPVSRFVAPGSSSVVNAIIKVPSLSSESERTVYGVPKGIEPEIRENFVNETWEFNTEFGPVAFTYLGGHRSYDSDTFSAQSLQPSPPPGPPSAGLYDWANYRGTAETNQHEVRLSNAMSGRLDWIIGYNWYREDLSESDHNWSAPLVNPNRGNSVPGIDPLNETDHESSGVFGQVTFGLTDRLHATAGVRSSKDEVVRKGTFAVGGGQVDKNGQTCVYPNDCVGGPNNGTQSANKTTWRVGMDFKPSDNTMLYGSVATGYKAGGFNDFEPSTGGVGPYNPEELTAYEVGFKGTLLSNLTVESALFLYDYSAAQISSLVNVQGNVVLYTRLAPIDISGWENDLTWMLSGNDTLRFGFSLMKGEYGDGFKAGGHAPGAVPPIGAEFTDWSGRSIDKVSDLTLRFEYMHDWPLASGAKITGRLASRYDSGYIVSNITEAFQWEQKAYTRTDANLIYTSVDDRFDVSVFVRNLEDKVQVLGAPDAYSGATQGQVGAGVTEPRVYGVRFGAKF